MSSADGVTVPKSRTSPSAKSSHQMVMCGLCWGLMAVMGTFLHTVGEPYTNEHALPTVGCHGMDCLRNPRVTWVTAMPQWSSQNAC